MQDTVHRLLYIFCIDICRFLCNLLSKLSLYPYQTFLHFFSYFTKAGIANVLFFDSSSSVYAIQLCVAPEVRFHRRPFYSIRFFNYPTPLCRNVTFSAITETKNLPLLSQYYSANKFCFFPMQFVSLCIYIHGILLVSELWTEL